MPENKDDIERLRYNLESEKFSWQREAQRTENKLLNRHFGVIITAIVSIAAVIVSYQQITISANNAGAQLVQFKNEADSRRETAKSQLEIEQLKNARQFEL